MSSVRNHAVIRRAFFFGQERLDSIKRTQDPEVWGFACCSMFHVRTEETFTGTTRLVSLWFIKLTIQTRFCDSDKNLLPIY